MVRRREGKGTTSPRVAFQCMTLRRRARPGEATNCHTEEERRQERLGMRKDLIAGKLVRINETMQALTFLMDVRG